MKKLGLVLSLSAMMTLTGCTTQSFTINSGATGTEPNYESMQPFFVYGIGQTQRLNASDICGGADKVAKVEAKESFLNGLLGFLSTGIYTPRDAKVYCIK